MPIPLRFDMRLSSDHETPSTAIPTVNLYALGASTAWSVAQGAVSTSGEGTWSVAPNASDQPAGAAFCLLYAVAPGADPSIGWYYLGDPTSPTEWPYQAGSVPSIPLPFWLGSVASANYEPATGVAPVVSLSASGTPAVPGAGTVAEVGNGFYSYGPTLAEMSSSAFAAGSYADLVLTASATGAVDSWADFQVVTPPAGAGGAIGLETGFGLLLEGGSGSLLLEGGLPRQGFREALIAKLGSIPEVAAIVGSAIYPGQLPETHDLGRDGPALTYLVVSNPRGHILTGSDGTSTARVRLDAWGYQLSQVDALTTALWEALDGVPDTWGNGTLDVMSVSQGDESDEHEPPRAGSDQWTYHISTDYRVRYRTGFPTLA
jgi:hypothetical protein